MIAFVCDICRKVCPDNSKEGMMRVPEGWERVEFKRVSHFCDSCSSDVEAFIANKKSLFND